MTRFVRKMALRRPTLSHPKTPLPTKFVGKLSAISSDEFRLRFTTIEEADEPLLPRQYLRSRRAIDEGNRAPPHGDIGHPAGEEEAVEVPTASSERETTVL